MWAILTSRPRGRANIGDEVHARRELRQNFLLFFGNFMHSLIVGINKLFQLGVVLSNAEGSLIQFLSVAAAPDFSLNFCELLTKLSYLVIYKALNLR